MCVALILGFVYLKSSGRFAGDPQVSAQLANAGGSLTKGSDVKLRGVIIGRVDAIRRGPDGGVRVALSMKGQGLSRVPDNVVARILPATVFGTTFVDLVIHGAPSTATMKEGSVIPADRTQGTLELQQALDDIDRLVKALGPAELASAIGSTAMALDGRGDQLGSIVERLNGYLEQINPKLPLVRSDLGKLADNLELLRKVAPDLLDAVDDGLVTARTIVEQKATIAALISGGTTLVSESDAFLGANQQAFVRFLNGSASFLDALYDNRHAGIVEAFHTNATVPRLIKPALEHGFVHTDASINAAIPPFYGPDDRPTYGSPGANRAAPSGQLHRATVSSMLEGSGAR